LCGHARVLAARQLNIRAIPAVRASHLSESQKRAFVLADNRLAELASWNAKSLKRELQFLSELDIDYDFHALGFDTAQIDFILADGGEADDRADALPQTLDVPAVSRPGDLWQLEQHRLYCGSALESASYLRLLAHDRADMVFTDPPYNVPIQGHVGGRGGVKHREFAMASGEMTDAQFTEFLSTFLQRVESFAQDGAICFVCMDWRHTEHLLNAAQRFTLKSICVWVKITLEWARSTDPNTSLFLSLNAAPPITSTMSSLVNTVALARPCGNIVASIALAATATSS
jgi:hypothetical protein